ncbi:30S ribosomal protein S7 [Candidatus Dojkabacteria bacterium]|nr:30S ribosomal protein S7 [Candidatus Dojkabacteria bacterium]
MRGKKASAREIEPDAKFKSKLVTKFINIVMQDGKKSVAEKIMYEAMDLLEKGAKKKKALEALEEAIDNVKPKVEVRSRRVGGANYQVPVPVNERRQQSLAIRWIVEAARGNRGSSTFSNQLGQVLLQSFKKEGAAFKKKEDTHKMAEANRAFARFAW